MEFKQLEMLVAVAEERSIARAAERVFRTPPAVSMALAKLEEEIGADLFRRAGRSVELTTVGRALSEYARKLLALRDEAAAQFRSWRDLPCSSQVSSTSN